MSMDYETFRQHQERYEKEKRDREDAENWRKHLAEQEDEERAEKKKPAKQGGEEHAFEE